VCHLAQTESVNVARARYLVSDRGREALEALPVEFAALPINQLASELRKDHAPDEASALAEQVTLRARAAGRLEDPSGWLLTTEGLEMMTHPLVARRRALRLANLGLPVVDLTCGLGGDLRAIAHAGLETIGCDRTATTALFAHANVPQASIVVADATSPPMQLANRAVMLDPSRRGSSGRRFDPAAFSPTWTAALQLLEGSVAGVMKAPPGIDHQHIPPRAEVEFVQVGRSMREATLWTGKGATAGLRRAVLLRGTGAPAFELDSLTPQVSDDCTPVSRFVFDPESCVTRAGLVRHLAQRLSTPGNTVTMLDPQIAYLTAGSASFDPLCATFQVLEVVPFSVARLRARLRERGWRADEVRRRGFPVEPDELLRQLGKMEGERVALLLTTLAARRVVIVARQVYDSAPTRPEL
jgi:hypothetical protein